MKLYHFALSSASWRVRIGLAHKGIEAESIAVDLHAGEQHGEGFAAVNPMHQVPVLEWEEAGVTRRLGQSLAILAMLEAWKPEPALLPADPYLRGRAWQLAELVNAGIQPLQNSYVMSQVGLLGGDPVAWAVHHVGRGLDALEAEAAGAGTSLVGDAVTVADLCLVPQLQNARRFGMDLQRWPTLVRVDAACAELPAFRAAHPKMWGAV